MNETNKARLALLPVLAEHAPNGHIGRTALMKYMYFLQTVRGMPLGYNFSMYSYGPFDSDVLADLSSAEMLNIVDVAPVEFAGGYGYRITPGPKADLAKRSASQFLMDHGKDLDWLLSVFGRLNSAELELTSTIVYVDREFAKMKQHVSISDVAARVNEVKPRFTREQVRGFVEDLLRQGILMSTDRSMSTAS
jgi:uncharacterized protein YwgA